jgi:hypothetical protein
VCVLVRQLWATPDEAKRAAAATAAALASRAAVNDKISRLDMYVAGTQLTVPVPSASAAAAGPGMVTLARTHAGGEHTLDLLRLARQSVILSEAERRLVDDPTELAGIVWDTRPANAVVNEGEAPRPSVRGGPVPALIAYLTWYREPGAPP